MNNNNTVEEEDSLFLVFNLQSHDEHIDNKTNDLTNEVGIHRDKLKEEPNSNNENDLEQIKKADKVAEEKFHDPENENSSSQSDDTASTEHVTEEKQPAIETTHRNLNTRNPG